MNTEKFRISLIHCCSYENLIIIWHLDDIFIFGKYFYIYYRIQLIIIEF